MATKKAKTTPRGKCSLVVSGTLGAGHGYKTYRFPVSWRGRDAAARMVRSKKFAHAVLALDCGVEVGGRNSRTSSVTLASCDRGACQVLGGASNKRVEHRHRGKAAYNRTIAGVTRR